MIKRAVITGAGGFIGKHLLQLLIDNDVEVLAFVLNRDELSEMRLGKNVEVIEASFAEYSSLEQKTCHRGFDVFYHLAWQGTFGDSFRDYHMQMHNAAFAGDALMAAKKLDCKKFILAGTMVELEVKKYMNMQDCQPRISCIYGTAKVAAEMLCKVLAYNHQISYNCAMLASVYGVGDHSRMIQNVLLDSFSKGISPKLVEGTNLYDWIHVSDVANALFAIADKGTNMKTYYVGHRTLQTFQNIVTQVRDLIDPNIILKFGELTDTTVVDYSLIDLDELYRDTGFEPTVDFSESILQTAEWVKSLNW